MGGRADDRARVAEKMPAARLISFAARDVWFHPGRQANLDVLRDVTTGLGRLF